MDRYLAGGSTASFGLRRTLNLRKLIMPTNERMVMMQIPMLTPTCKPMLMSLCTSKLNWAFVPAIVATNTRIKDVSWSAVIILTVEDVFFSMLN